MRRLLVAIDGSDSALRALDFAVRQARAADDIALHMISVTPPVRVYGELEVYAGVERMRELAAAESRALLTQAGERLAPSRVTISVEQLEGDPAECIARRATELGCESIVMGTHGHGRFGALLLGSVAQRVVHLATVPVTLVK